MTDSRWSMKMQIAVVSFVTLLHLMSRVLQQGVGRKEARRNQQSSRSKQSSKQARRNPDRQQPTSKPAVVDVVVVVSAVAARRGKHPWWAERFSTASFDVADGTLSNASCG